MRVSPWPGRARPRSSRRSGTQQDLWVGFKPYGMGETKPNHYRRHGQDRLGEPRQPPVRVADPAARACATAARSASPASTTGRSRACTSARPGSTCCGSTRWARSTRRSSPTSSRCGSCSGKRAARPRPAAVPDGAPARASAGFTRVSWDEALDLVADRIRATIPTRSRCTSPRAGSPTRCTTSRRR